MTDAPAADNSGAPRQVDFHPGARRRVFFPRGER
jgi:hypothetical protein